MIFEASEPIALAAAMGTAALGTADAYRSLVVVFAGRPFARPPLLTLFFDLMILEIAYERQPPYLVNPNKPRRVVCRYPWQTFRTKE